MSTNDFFLKNYVLKKGKILVFGKELKWKVAIRIHYNQAGIDILPKITLQLKFFLWSSFTLVLLKGILKIHSGTLKIAHQEESIRLKWNLIHAITTWADAVVCGSLCFARVISGQLLKWLIKMKDLFDLKIEIIK